MITDHGVGFTWYFIHELRDRVGDPPPDCYLGMIGGLMNVLYLKMHQRGQTVGRQVEKG